MRRYDKFTSEIPSAPPAGPDPVSDLILEERRKAWMLHPCTIFLFEYFEKELLDVASRIDALALLPEAALQIQILTIKQKTFKEILDYARRV